MKQSLKFGLLLVLALLIHCVTNGTMEDICKVTSPTYRQEKCYVSQDRPIHNAIERLYNLYSTQSCDMSHTDVAHVPTDKSMLLLIAYFCEHYKLQSPPYSFSLHTPNYLYDPVTHYIYGLRKIVIQTSQGTIFYSIYFRQSTSSPVGEGFVVHFYNIQSKQLLNYEFYIFSCCFTDSACFCRCCDSSFASYFPPLIQ